MKKNTTKSKTALLLGIAIIVTLGTVAVKSQTVEEIPAQSLNQSKKIRQEDASHAFNLPDYSKITVGELEQKTDQVLEQRLTAIAKLITQAEDSQMPNAQKAEVIYLLGALRAPEAVIALIENINFVDGRVLEKTSISDRGGYIARRALVKIGEPSARWIYLIVADNHNADTVRFNESQVEGFVEVLAEIETSKVALMKLRDGREKARNAEIKKNFDLVIEGLKNLEK